MVVRFAEFESSFHVLFTNRISHAVKRIFFEPVSSAWNKSFERGFVGFMIIPIVGAPAAMIAATDGCLELV